MPLTFPSHQGLVAPLWRRWPDRFHVLGLCIGAAVPDLVDGVAGAFRGRLGQWFGHSLLGLLVLCLPAGLVLTWLVMVVGGWLGRKARADSAAWRSLGRVARAIGRIGHVPVGFSAGRRAAFVGLSVLVGGFSHLVFDLISHGSFFWFHPWEEGARFLPSWWYAAWFKLPFPGYADPYPIGPHFAVWAFLSLLGIVMLFGPSFSGKKGR